MAHESFEQSPPINLTNEVECADSGPRAQRKLGPRQEHTIGRVELRAAASRAIPSLLYPDAARIVDHLLEEMATSLLRGEVVSIRGLGRFLTADKAERVARNPKTGTPATVTARRVVRFRPSRVLRKKLAK